MKLVNKIKLLSITLLSILFLSYLLNYLGVSAINKFMYGFNSVFESSPFLVIYGIAVLLVASAIALYPKIAELLVRARLPPSENKLVAFAAIAIIFFILFNAFGAQVYSGDPWGKIGARGETELKSRFFMSSPITSYLNYKFYDVMSDNFGWSPEKALGFASTIRGALFIFVLLMLVSVLDISRLGKAITFGLVSTAGFMQIYFNYNGSSDLLGVFTLLFIYVSYQYIKGKIKYIEIPAAVAAVMFWSHGSAGFFLPALLYLHIASTKVDKFNFDGVKKIFFSKQFARMVLGFMLPTAILFGFIEFEASTYFGTHITDIKTLSLGDFAGGGDAIMFFPLVEPQIKSYAPYNVFSLKHLLDFLNYMVLITGIGMFALVVTLVSLRKRINFREPFIFFLLTMVVFDLLFILTWGTDTKFYSIQYNAGFVLNTWYPESIFAVVVLLLLGYVLARYVNRENLVQIGTSAIFTNLVILVPWVLHNAGVL